MGARLGRTPEWYLIPVTASGQAVALARARPVPLLGCVLYLQLSARFLLALLSWLGADTCCPFKVHVKCTGVGDLDLDWRNQLHL